MLTMPVSANRRTSWKNATSGASPSSRNRLPRCLHERRRQAQAGPQRHALHRPDDLIWFTGAIRLYKDGDYSCSVLFRWWHPVTWLLYVVMIIPCAIVGEAVTDVLPVKLSKFWQRNIGQLRWVTPWTDLNQVPRFNHSLVVREEVHDEA